MPRPRRNWTIDPFTVTRQAGRYIQPSYPAQTPDAAGPIVPSTAVEAVELHGCMITDTTQSVRYEVTVDTSDGEVTLTSLTVLPLKPGQRIDQAMLGRIPTQRLARACARFLVESGGRDMTRTVSEPALPGERPSLHDVAQQWRDHGGDRHVIAKLHHVSPATVSKWFTDARRAGLIPPDPRRRGRKPASTSAPSGPSGSAELEGGRGSSTPSGVEPRDRRRRGRKPASISAPSGPSGSAGSKGAK